VTDFGLAKELYAADALTMTEQMLGTPVFMAPEQAHSRFGEVAEQTDVYGLAATLFALLTGTAPIGNGPIVEILQQLASDAPVSGPRELRQDVPPSLDSICRKGLAKRASERYSSVRELSEELQAWLVGAIAANAQNLPPTALSTTPTIAAGLAPGGHLGQYRLIKALSNDRTRLVFHAEDANGCSVLLKCLPPEWMSDRLKRSQFRQEVLLSCGLSHPCLAKVLEAGEINGIEFLALEYITGESVSRLVARDGRLSEQLAVEVLAPIADALHHIHEAGVIYRDLRPQNVLLCDDGRPVLSEVRFSDELAELDNVTMMGRGEVTSKYVAPEVLLGRPADVASDVYTLGATLYAMVTGHDPFDEQGESINVLIAKNSARYTPPRNHAPDLSDALDELIAVSLRPRPEVRPATASQFAQRLKGATQNTASDDTHQPAVMDEIPTDSMPIAPNLLHDVWDQLDPELQDAFSLAYNKKRRAGSTRISTRDLFAALARLGTGSLRQLFDELPPGALPEPVDEVVPIDHSLLHEQPLLSDCVQDSLTAFQTLATRRRGAVPLKIAPMDLFVDIAKNGHGPSVARLREHGIDGVAIDRMVDKLRLPLTQRESILKPPQPATEKSSGGWAEEYLVDENVQFSVYRPNMVRPQTWAPLLAFAHLSELPGLAPEGTPDPLDEVQRQAEQVLADKFPAYRSVSSDSSQPVPRSSELTFVPWGDGLEFNPPQRSFLWRELVHREEFRFRAAARLDGQLARGRLSVYLGSLLLAEVSIVTRVDRNAPRALSKRALTRDANARPFRKIYACVAREDCSMVSEFENYARLLRDTFVISQIPSGATPDALKRAYGLIGCADIFQLYWSRNAIDSPEIEEQWRYALSLNRLDFMRLLYWEEPFPTNPARSLPPPELLTLGFQKIPAKGLGDYAFSGAARRAPSGALSHKLGRVRTSHLEKVGKEATDVCAAPRSDRAEIFEKRTMLPRNVGGVERAPWKGSDSPRQQRRVDWRWLAFWLLGTASLIAISWWLTFR
jgi:serine/threonine protein kinase